MAFSRENKVIFLAMNDCKTLPLCRCCRFGTNESMAMISVDEYTELMHSIIIGDPLHGGVVTEPTRILNHVYIGSQSNAERLPLLRQLGVTHVLNCAGYRGHRTSSTSPYDGCHIEYYEFQASSEHILLQYFYSANITSLVNQNIIH